VTTLTVKHGAKVIIACKSKMMMRKPREHSDSESGSAVAQKGPQKVVLDLGSACNALCLNRDSTLLAAAGRKVFKILKLGADQIEVQNDFRDLPHKQLNLNYSSNDVQWNPKDGGWTGVGWNHLVPRLRLTMRIELVDETKLCPH
jgi:hypothetical protein